MMTKAISPVRPEIGKALREIQSHWSDGERARRHRVAEWRQRRLLSMIEPHEDREAYDCVCDTDSNCPAGDDDTIGLCAPHERRSHRYVVIAE
jgi:hypothetical protein